MWKMISFFNIYLLVSIRFVKPLYLVNEDNENLLTGYRCTFEPNNRNELIIRDKNRSQYLDVNSDDAIGMEVIMQYAKMVRKYYFQSQEIVSLRSCYEEILKVSENSKLAYDQFIHNTKQLQNESGYFPSLTTLIAKIRTTILRDNYYPLLDFNFIINAVGSEKAHLLNLYNYLSKYYGIENIKRWLFTLVFTNNIQKRYSGVLGITVLNSFYGYQFIALDPNILSKNVVFENYQLGHWVSNNIITGVIHEYGHMLEFALSFLPEQLNKNILPNKVTNNESNYFLNNWFSQVDYKNINNNNIRGYKVQPSNFSASNEFIRFVGEKLGFNPADINVWEVEDNNEFLEINRSTLISALVSKLFVDSRYGKFTNWNEQFAELLSQWLLTPNNYEQNKLSVRWTLLNEFF